jgi:hypothetical protein
VLSESIICADKEKADMKKRERKKKITRIIRWLGLKHKTTGNIAAAPFFCNKLQGGFVPGFVRGYEQARGF